MKTWQNIAMFMIYLIISLPFVFAQELSIQKFQGANNARGYIRSQDELTIEVLAKIPGEDVIDKEQLRLYWQGMYTTFDWCNATSGGYHTCRFYEPEFESYEPLDLSIEMRDDSENVVGQESQTLNIDNQAPVIKEINADPTISNGPITISYVAEDYGLTYGDTSLCSGLKAITVKTGTTTHATDSAPLGECTKDNVLNINFDTAGTKQICITALDYVNFSSPPRCTEVKIDKAPPSIEELNILDPEGFTLTHVHSGEERTADVNVIITDDGEVDLESVAANFNQLNPNLPDFIPPDSSSGDIYIWQNIPVSEVSTCQITVKARDTLGNEKTENFPCTVKADDTPPTFIQLAADATRDGTPLYGYDTTLTIEFEDKDNTGGAGIGLAGRNVNLDMSEMGMGTVQPDYCLKLSGANWACSWLMTPPLTLPESTYTLILTAESADDLGNALGSEQTFDIIYDHTGPGQPQIIDHKVVTGEAGVTYAGGAVRGDFVQYKVRSQDFETAYANFSDIGGNDAEPATICEAGDCTFESMVILDGPFTANLSFSFYDDALNKASTSTALEIYAIDNATTANYWQKPSITCSPSLIDRETATIMPPIVTCRLDLSTPNPKVSTLAIAGPTAPDQCTGDIALNVNDIYMINNGEGSKSPYLFIVLEPKEYMRNTLNISCPITIYSKREQTTAGTTRYYVTPIPQTINANITLQFYNNPLGMIHNNTDQKIIRAMDDSFANAKWLGELRKYLYYAETACWIKNLIMTALGTLYAITGVVTAIATGAKLFVYSKPAGDGIAQAAVGLCKGEEDIAEQISGPGGGGKEILAFLNSVCSIASCQAEGGYQSGAGFIGGGVPWCKDPSALIGKGGVEWFKTAEKQFGGLILPSIKDSLILSIICFCLPGIIYNVEKLRQINCWKAVCLNDYVKEQGHTTEFCDEMHDYFICTYVMGEMFSIMPFVRFFDKLIDIVTTFLSDPWALITTVLGGLCKTLCTDSGEPVPAALIAFMGCALLKTLSTLMESISAVQQMTDKKAQFGTPPGSQYCDRMEEIKEDMETE